MRRSGLTLPPPRQEPQSESAQTQQRQARGLGNRPRLAVEEIVHGHDVYARPLRCSQRGVAAGDAHPRDALRREDDTEKGEAAVRYGAGRSEERAEGIALGVEELQAGEIGGIDVGERNAESSYRGGGGAPRARNGEEPLR